ncbi:MAG: hypothetical protein ABI723_01460 [Bacteroidia bacterium]
MNNLTGNLLYLLSVLLAFTWAVGFYGHQVGGAFHLTLVCAAVIAYISIWDIEKLKPKRKQHKQRLA